MKLKRTKLLLSLILVFAIAGCTTDCECFKGTGINGEWIWVESVGGFGGWTLTPESEGLNKRFVIDDFIIKSYINDSLVLETEYELGMYDQPVWGTKTFIRYDSGGEQAITIGATELELIDLCFDCYIHRYKRN